MGEEAPTCTHAERGCLLPFPIRGLDHAHHLRAFQAKGSVALGLFPPEETLAREDLMGLAAVSRDTVVRVEPWLLAPQGALVLILSTHSILCFHGNTLLLGLSGDKTRMILK